MCIRDRYCPICGTAVKAAEIPQPASQEQGYQEQIPSQIPEQQQVQANVQQEIPQENIPQSEQPIPNQQDYQQGYQQIPPQQGYQQEMCIRDRVLADIYNRIIAVSSR